MIRGVQWLGISAVVLLITITTTISIIVVIFLNDSDSTFSSSSSPLSFPAVLSGHPADLVLLTYCSHRGKRLKKNPPTLEFKEMMPKTQLKLLGFYGSLLLQWHPPLSGPCLGLCVLLGCALPAFSALPGLLQAVSAHRGPLFFSAFVSRHVISSCSQETVVCLHVVPKQLEVVGIWCVLEYPWKKGNKTNSIGTLGLPLKLHT